MLGLCVGRTKLQYDGREVYKISGVYWDSSHAAAWVDERSLDPFLFCPVMCY